MSALFAKIKKQSSETEIQHFIEILTGNPLNIKQTIPNLLYQYVWVNPSEWKG